jgi:hypothetical protein
MDMDDIGCRRLMAAVISRALFDACSKDRSLRDEAQTWLFAGEGAAWAVNLGVSEDREGAEEQFSRGVANIRSGDYRGERSA